MKVTIAGHDLSPAQLDTLNAIQDYLKKNPPAPSLHEIFPAHNNIDNARRRTARRLSELGVLRACGILVTWH